MDPEQLLRALTLDEKALLTAGADMWSTPSIERVGSRLDRRPFFASGGGTVTRQEKIVRLLCVAAPVRFYRF